MPSAERDARREFEILTAIGEDQALTQRALAERLGVALGLTNLYLRRLVRTGHVKVAGLNRRRLRYLLTPKGVAQKTRLTYEHMTYWASLYRRARRTLREGLEPFLARGGQRIALYGTGEAAELAYLTLRERGLEPVAVFDKGGGGVFLGHPVRDVRELAAADVDGVIVAASLDRPNGLLAELEALGIRRERLVPLRPPARARKPRGEAHGPR
jgi:DNA-binding MarR family transcriptional regulator